jgi:hypothetical protein
MYRSHGTQQPSIRAPEGLQSGACRSEDNLNQAGTEKLALERLEAFERQWGEQYPQIIKSWRDNWDNISTLFQYHPIFARQSTPPMPLNLSTA